MVTVAAKQHEILKAVDLGRACSFAACAVFTKSHDVRRLREIAFRGCHRMLEKILVAAAKLATASAAGNQPEFHVSTYIARLLYGRFLGRFGNFFCCHIANTCARSYHSL